MSERERERERKGGMGGRKVRGPSRKQRIRCTGHPHKVSHPPTTVLACASHYVFGHLVLITTGTKSPLHSVLSCALNWTAPGATHLAECV